MKEWLKNIRIPKTLVGLVLIGVGTALKNQMLVNAGIAIATVGGASKAIKTVQGNDPFRHEKLLFNIQPKEK